VYCGRSAALVARPLSSMACGLFPCRSWPTPATVNANAAGEDQHERA
jgi:hypothetical protein